MNFKIIQPSSVLAPYIKYYWMLESCVSQKETYHHRIIPNGFVELIFYYNDTPEYLRKSTRIKSKAIISGQQNEYYDIAITGEMKLFSVIFKPQASRLFLGLPVNELTNQSISADIIFKGKINSITERLADTSEIYKKVEIVESFLVEQITQNRDFSVSRISDSVGYINMSRGFNQVELLASRACLSRKQFERVFGEFVGLTPKQFLKIIRFQYSIYLQQKEFNNNLAALAYDSGYYDQSHMINDYKSLSGLTPSQYFEQCEPFSDYFS